MILVTGATGNVGRPLVAQLLARGADVRAVTRYRTTADLPRAADVVEADPSRPDSLAGAFEDVTAVFLNARAVQTAASELLTLARRAGVARAVALAASNVEEDHARQPSRWRGDLNAELEQTVVASGLDWVSLRPAEYASNLIGLWAAQLRSGDVIRAPYGASQHAPSCRPVAAVSGPSVSRGWPNRWSSLLGDGNVEGRAGPDDRCLAGGVGCGSCWRSVAVGACTLISC